MSNTHRYYYDILNRNGRYFGIYTHKNVSDYLRLKNPVFVRKHPQNALFESDGLL